MSRGEVFEMELGVDETINAGVGSGSAGERLKRPGVAAGVDRRFDFTPRCAEFDPTAEGRDGGVWEFAAWGHFQFAGLLDGGEDLVDGGTS